MQQRKQALDDAAGDPPSMKKGGMVKKTGKILMHKGEAVITSKLASKPVVKQMVKQMKASTKKGR
jgi:hypothetical protein